MPVTIKTKAMKYKNAEGEYEDFNAIAQQSTTEQIAAIQNAGSAQIEAINSQGQYVVNSIIPEGQTELSNKVEDLKSAIDDTGITLITQSPYLTQGYIDSNGKWANRTTGNPRCAIFPVSGGESLLMVAGTTTTQIAALKSFSDPADGTSADYSEAADWTDLIQVTTGTSFSGKIPADANYLYVWLGNATGYARKPKSFVIDGYDFIKSANNNIQSIARNKAPIDSPTFTGTPKSVTPDSSSSLTDIATAAFVKNVALNVTQYAAQIGTDSTNKTDIDALRTPGTYRVISSTNAGNVIGNPPTKTVAYKLIVVETTQADRVYQIALINSATMPIRYRYYGNIGWTGWKVPTLDFNSFAGSKNLIPATEKSYTGQSVTRSYSDGIISLNNIATASGGKSNPITENFTLTAGKYTMSLSYINLKALSCFLRDTDGNDIANVVNILNPVTFTLSSPKECYIGVNVTSGTDYSGKQIKIQLEKSAEQHDFEAPSFQTAIDSVARQPIENILSAFTNIECAGDSLTYGAVYTSDSSYRQANKPYPAILGHITGAQMTYLATPGSNASEWWAEYKDSISAKTNALAIIFLGTNGGLTDTISTDVSGNDPTQWANTHTGNYARIVNAYITAGYKVVLVKCFMTSASANLDATNSVIQQMADKFGCGLIENDYMDNISYHYTPDKTYANTLHYNDLGYAAMAYRIAENVSHMSETYRANIIPN